MNPHKSTLVKSTRPLRSVAWMSSAACEQLYCWAGAVNQVAACVQQQRLPVSAAMLWAMIGACVLLAQGAGAVIGSVPATSSPGAICFGSPRAAYHTLQSQQQQIMCDDPAPSPLAALFA